MSVAWPQEKLSECMLEMYDDSLWTDVTFHCKDHEGSEGIHAHKIVLSARSPVFRAMFFGPCADSKKDIELEKAEAKSLDLFFRYLYSDSTDLSQETAPSVLELAHYYQVTYLVQFCANYLASVLTTENACQILKMAMFYQIESLTNACCSIIDKNADKILKSDEFLSLSAECLKYIIKGDTFNAEEKEIFIKAEAWAAQNLKRENLAPTGANVKEILGETFYHLRLPTMMSKTLVECTRRKGYFSAEEYEDMLDYINHIPGSSVRTNSSIARIPKEEELTVTGLIKSIMVTDTVSVSFEITVSRNVRLMNICLAEIQHGLNYDHKLYKISDSHWVGITEPSINKFFINYKEQVLKFGYGPNKCIKTLDGVQEEKLSKYFDVMLSGCLQISSLHNSANKTASVEPKITEDYQVEQEMTETDPTTGAENGESSNAESDDGSDSSNVKDDGKDEGHKYLIYNRIFRRPFSEVSGGMIPLQQPVMLTEAKSPYLVKLYVRYPGDQKIKMKVPCCMSADNTLRSKHGHITVKSATGAFAGIRSIGFENTSNRENSEIP